MRGAHGDGERIDLRLANEFHRFVGIGQKLVVGQLAFGTVAVFLLALAGFQRTQNAEFAFNGNAAQMRHVRDLLRHADIVVPVGGRLAVFLQRAVHHHRGEAGLDCRHAGGGIVAMVEMHADRNLRIDFGQGIHHVLEHDVVGILARAARRLDDDRRIDSGGGFADGERLFHIVDVESGHAVAVFGGVIEQLTHCDAGHEGGLPCQ